MFGYVMPQRDKLEDEEFAHFQKYYCGVCTSMGFFARFALTFDCSFLALASCSVDNAPCNTTKKRCPGRPYRKKEVLYNEHIRYAADINTILAYYKICDDIQDEGGFMNRVVKLLLTPAFKKAKKRQREIAETIKALLDRLEQLEQIECEVTDLVADPFAKLLEEVALHSVESVEDKETFGRMFYNIGRWIYLIDAMDDYQEDLEKEEYNVLHLEWKEEQKAREAMDFSLWHTLSEVERCYTAIEHQQETLPILENVVLLSLPAKTAEVLYRGGYQPEPV